MTIYQEEMQRKAQHYHVPSRQNQIHLRALLPRLYAHKKSALGG